MKHPAPGTSTLGVVAKVKCLTCGHLAPPKDFYYDHAKGEAFARCARCGQPVK